MDFGILLLIIIAIGLMMVFLGSHSQARARDTARLAAIERKLDAIMRRLEIEEPPLEEPDVVRLLEQGQKIQAIKAYRDRTGVGLAEAKAAVERVERERGLGPS